MNERHFGPLRLVVEGPEGWDLRAPADPLLERFLRPLDGASAQRSLQVELLASVRPEGARFVPKVITSGWLLEEAGSTLRWTLPDGADGWFWRLSIDAAGHRVELGAALCDPEEHCAQDPICYPLDQIITIHELTPCGGLLVHAAGFAHDQRVVLAAGVSGAGKTTLARLLRAAEPDLVGLSDDRIIVAPGNGASWTAWGTPWAGEGRIAGAAAGELTALVVMHHADHEALEPLDPSAALAELLPATSIPWYSPSLAERALDRLGELVQQVPAWRLSFRPVAEAAALVRGLFA